MISKERSLAKMLEVLTNSATLIVAVVVLGLGIRGYVQRRPDIGSSGLPLGSAVDIRGVDWSANGRTAVFVMQTHCQYCEASMPFYRDLVTSGSPVGFGTLALFPEPVSQAKEFLNKNHLTVGDVRQADFSTLRIVGTPTLLLVDNSGHLESRWIGELTRKQETEVFAKLMINRKGVSQSQRTESVENELKNDRVMDVTELARSYRNMPVVDIRPRPEFMQGHISGSVNIPLDELEARAPHELPTDRDLLLYCYHCSECAGTLERGGVATGCDLAEMVLKQIGFSRFRRLTLDLTEIGTAGISVVRPSEGKVK